MKVRIRYLSNKNYRTRKIKCDPPERNIPTCGKVHRMFGRIFFHHRIGHGEGGFESNEPVNTSTFITGIYILVIII